MISPKIQIKIEGNNEDIQPIRNDLVESLTNYELTNEIVRHPNQWDKKLTQNKQNSLIYLTFNPKR